MVESLDQLRAALVGHPLADASFEAMPASAAGEVAFVAPVVCDAGVAALADPSSVVAATGRRPVLVGDSGTRPGGFPRGALRREGDAFPAEICRAAATMRAEEAVAAMHADDLFDVVEDDELDELGC